MRNGILAICLVATACTTQAAERAPADGEPVTSSVESALGNACSLQCNDASEQCDATCERFPRPDCEENCDTRLANCMRACGCPFTQEFDRVSLDHADFTGSGVCVGTIPNPGVVYLVYNLFDRTDHVQQVQQCDGTITETVLSSVVAPAGACTHETAPAQACRPSTTSPVGLCVF